MSMLDEWGFVSNGCPRCGSDLQWWYFDSDCRGNPSSSGVNCRICKYEKNGLEDAPKEKRTVTR